MNGSNDHHETMHQKTKEEKKLFGRERGRDEERGNRLKKEHTEMILRREN